MSRVVGDKASGPVEPSPPPASVPRVNGWVGPALIVLAVVVVQAGGGFITVTTINEGWYAGLLKPAWTPPARVFGPVWTVLYTLMAAAACVVWANRRTHDIRRPMLAFAVQLGLNLLWSVLFFGLRSPTAAFAEIVVLVALVATTLVLFHRVNRWAGYLLIPYLLWVVYASTINLGVATMNP